MNNQQINRLGMLWDCRAQLKVTLFMAVRGPLKGVAYQNGIYETSQDRKCGWSYIALWFILKP